MLRISSWVMVSVAFCILTGYKGYVPDIPVNNMQGIQATKYKVDPHHPELVSVIGVIVTRSTNEKGQCNIKLEADDGTPLVVTIPPTVTASVPHVGTRIQVEGTVITPGVISINNYWNIKTLAPSYKFSNRVVLNGIINHISDSRKGTRANISQNDTYAESLYIPKNLRFETSLFGQEVTVVGYRQANGIIYVEEIQ